MCQPYNTHVSCTPVLCFCWRHQLIVGDITTLLVVWETLICQAFIFLIDNASVWWRHKFFVVASSVTASPFLPSDPLLKLCLVELNWWKNILIFTDECYCLFKVLLEVLVSTVWSTESFVGHGWVAFKENWNVWRDVQHVVDRQVVEQLTIASIAFIAWTNDQ